MARDQDHHSPAVGDWPRGFDATWWPLLTVTGVAGIYVGLALLTIGTGTAIGPVTGPRALTGGLLLLFVSLSGWLWQGLVGRDREASRAFRLGTGLFLVTEVATFSAGFAAYGYFHLRAWPPATQPGLFSSLVVLNTLALVGSSVTLHLAADALEQGYRRAFVALLGTTLGLGLFFLAGQAWEYYEFIAHAEFTLTSGVLASVFFGLTGLHGLHVAAGVAALAVVLVRALAGHYTPERHLSVRTVSLYWHFVDAVWLCLVVVLYLGTAVTT